MERLQAKEEEEREDESQLLRPVGLFTAVDVHVGTVQAFRLDQKQNQHADLVTFRCTFFCEI